MSTYKVYCDASYSVDKSIVSIAGSIYNKNQLIAEFSHWEYTKDNKIEFENLAINHALSLLEKMHIAHATIYNDSLVLINKIKKFKQDNISNIKCSHYFKKTISYLNKYPHISFEKDDDKNIKFLRVHQLSRRYIYENRIESVKALSSNHIINNPYAFYLLERKEIKRGNYLFHVEKHKPAKFITEQKSHNNKTSNSNRFLRGIMKKNQDILLNKTKGDKNV